MVTQISERAESPARRRVLDTAAALFYAEGVHAVGIDRIIATAGVAKATFYHHFPAKDDLVRAYVMEQYHRYRESAEALQETDAQPRDILLRIFDAMGDFGAAPGYRGCAFINVAAEYPDPAHPVREAVAEQRRWLRGLIRGLLTKAGDGDPERTAGVLMLIRDGLFVGCDLDDPGAQRAMRDAVVRVLDSPVSA